MLGFSTLVGCLQVIGLPHPAACGRFTFAWAKHSSFGRAVGLIPQLSSGRQVAGLGSFLFGWLVFALLPAGIVPLDDDFGYLRSVVQTIQQQRPWTDDWLEPWSAGFSSLSALIFSACGNFRGATYGLLAILAMFSFGLCFSLIRQSGLKTAWALGLALLALTFPSVLWKLVQFTGVALYIPCLLAAIRAFQRRRWGIFLAAWMLAVSTRQSALVWILLPLGDLVGEAWRRRSFGLSQSMIPTLAVAVAGAAGFALLAVGMNKTHAQTIMTDRMWAGFSLMRGGQSTLLGAGVFFVAAGVHLLVQRLVQPPSPEGRLLRPTPALAAIGVTAAVVCALDLPSFVGWENEFLTGTVGSLYLKALVVAGAAGWLFHGGTLQPVPAITGLASIGLISLRAAVWDYYFIDVAVLGFCAAALKPAAESSSGALRLVRIVAAGAAAVALLVNGFMLLKLKARIDRAHLLTTISETALREGKLSPAELGYAPFGYRGWHLYPHFIRNEGKDAYIAGFESYLRPHAIQVGQGYSRALHLLPEFRHEPPADRHNLVASGHGPFLWFFRAEYHLLRFKSAHEAPAEMEFPASPVEKFPLNEGEWREYVAAARSR